MKSAVLALEIGDPPGFVQLVAHPIRWRLLRELTRSDRAVRELTERLREPQNLVSYHLRRLRDGGLVHTRRSAADGRDSYYSVDLTRCEQQLQTTGAALHPALWLTPTPPTPHAVSGARRRRVLFLCTGNSARSQMAEALLERTSAGTVDAASAGSHPKPLHPNAVRVMRTRGIDIGANRTKHLNELVSQRFDVVITLCDRVREVCPDFSSQTELVHWSMPDPARDATTNRASYPAFERTAAELETRIRFLLPLLADPPTVRLNATTTATAAGAATTPPPTSTSTMTSMLIGTLANAAGVAAMTQDTAIAIGARRCTGRGFPSCRCSPRTSCALRRRRGSTGQR